MLPSQYGDILRSNCWIPIQPNKYCGMYPPWKLTWQLKIHRLKMYFLLFPWGFSIATFGCHQRKSHFHGGNCCMHFGWLPLGLSSKVPLKNTHHIIYVDGFNIYIYILYVHTVYIYMVLHYTHIPFMEHCYVLKRLLLRSPYWYCTQIHMAWALT